MHLKCLVRKIHDGEVVATFLEVFVLVLDVVHNDLVSDCTGSGTEVPATPEVPAPEPFVEFGKVLQELPGRLAFDELRDLGYGNLWGHADEHMDVFLRDVTAYDLDAVLITDFSYQVAQSIGNTPLQDGLSVLRCPDQVVFEIEDRVGAGSIQFH